MHDTVIERRSATVINSHYTTTLRYSRNRKSRDLRYPKCFGVLAPFQFRSIVDQALLSEIAVPHDGLRFVW